ncbi:ATP-binding protein [Neiella marina]|uniref:ATP-binding protein n=1 Tax=Neiella marina TaxID=508461 RepID=UPI000B3CE4BB|nr:transporter substrate-binding domain-containing protein [Neiella marina]
MAVALLIYCIITPLVAADEQPVATDLPKEATKPNSLTIGLPSFSAIEKDWYGDFPKLASFLEQFWLDIGKKYDIRIQFKATSFATYLEVLESGEVDVIAIAPYADSLFQKAYFTIPYLSMKPAVYVRSNPSRHHKASAIHVPDFANFSLPSAGSMHRVFGDDLDDMLSRRNDYYLIYSWIPWVAESVLTRRDMRQDFKPQNQTAPPIFARAMMLRDRKPEVEFLNKVFRTINTEDAAALWQQNMGSQESIFQLTLLQLEGGVNQQLSEYLLENPVTYYAAMESGYPPYVVPDTAGVGGLAIDVLSSIGNRMGIEFQPIRVSNARLALKALDKGDIQLMPNVYKTPQREGRWHFSIPFGQSSPAFLSRAKDNFSSFEQLSDARIASIKDYYESHLMSTRLPNNEFLHVDSATEATQAIEDNRADVLLDDELAMIYRSKQGNFGDLVVNEVTDINEDLAFRMAVNLKHWPLVELVDIGLATFSPLEMDELRRKWGKTSTAVPDVSIFDHKYFYNIAFAVAFITFGVFLLQRLQIRQRKQAHREVEQALQQTQQARQDAERAARSQSDFLARMSHEIRTPMNGVLGMAEALSFTSLNKEQTELLTVLNGSARNLMALLNDVLDYSKIDAGKLTFEKAPVQLENLLNSVVDNFKHKTLSSELDLYCKLDPALNKVYLTDPTRLMQVLNNLVSNAIKFTHKGFVELNAQLIDDAASQSASQTGYHLVRFNIRDSGIGISAAKQNELFKPFVQADIDTTRKYGGSGLGLSICKEITEGMGGRISLSSLEGVGTLFTVELQLEPIKIEQEAKSVIADELSIDLEPAPQLAQLNVLVAEDNQVNIKVLTSQLACLGIKPVVALNGQEAYEKWQNGDFDVVLSDCHMPKMDGFTLARKISAERDNQHPRLIATTADALSDSIQRCQQAGFDDYLSKPFTLDTLRQKLLCLPQATTAPPSLAKESSDSGILNRAHVTGLIGDDNEVIQQVLQAFLEEQHLIADMEQALVSDGYSKLSELAHKMGGGLRYLGAQRAVSTCKAIENDAKQQRPSDYHNMLNQLAADLEQLEGEVERWLTDLSANRPSSEDKPT